MAYLANLLVPQSSLEEVKLRLGELMEEDGYEQLQRAVLFPHNEINDVRLFLINNGAAVVILGSGFKGEMGRIQKKFSDVSLLLWQERGPWGIRCYLQGEEVGRFENRKAGRFRNHVPNGTADWIAGAVKQFADAKEWREFHSCLRYGRWFTEWAVGKFCAGLGLPLAALSFDTVEKVWDGSLESRELDGWSIQMLAFQRRPEAGPKPTEESTLDSDESNDEMSMIEACFWSCVLLLTFPITVPLFILAAILHCIPLVRRALWGKGQRVRDQFLKAVKCRFSNPIQLSTGQIYNTIHRCSVKVPTGIRAKPKLTWLKPRDFLRHSPVFQFTLGNLAISATAHKPNSSWKVLESDSVEDKECRTEFQVGPYSGTRCFYQTNWHHYDWFIRTPKATYKFSINGTKEPVSEELTRKVDELVWSFELEPGEQADEGAVVCS